MRALIVVWTSTALVACAGKVDYIRPTTQLSPPTNVAMLNKPREVVWNAAVPELGKRFFVINNLDKSSGLINISYSGDPEKYVDCGRIVSYVKNARGERTYDFPGARRQQEYEVMNSNGLYFVNRGMQLDGRVNLIFEEITPSSTRVTASTKYVVQRTLAIRDVEGRSQSRTDSVNFNSGGSASFPSAGDGRATECAATGEIEREILSILR